MENNIAQTVYNSLAEDTAAISSDREALEQLESEIKARKYSDNTLKKEIFPKREELKRKISADSDRAIHKARSLVSDYRDSLKFKDALDPAELTADVELLKPGINLRERDIKAMIERNRNNRTMLQIIIRAAEDRGINPGVEYIGADREREQVDNLDNLLSYYRKWIDTDSSQYMLEQFFAKS